MHNATGHGLLANVTTGSTTRLTSGGLGNVFLTGPSGITWDTLGGKLAGALPRVDCADDDIRLRVLIRVPHGQPTPEKYVEIHRAFKHEMWVDEVVIEDERSPWPHRPGSEMMAFAGFAAWEKALEEHFLAIMAGPPDPEPAPGTGPGSILVGRALPLSAYQPLAQTQQAQQALQLQNMQPQLQNMQSLQQQQQNQTNALGGLSKLFSHYMGTSLK